MIYDYNSYGFLGSNVSCTYTVCSDSDKEVHSHNFIECFLVTKGTAIHKLNGKEETISEGDLVMLNLKDEHCFIRKSKSFCSHRDILIRNDFFKKCCDNISSNLYNDFLNGKYVKKISLPHSEWLSLQKFLFSLNSCVESNLTKANELGFIIVNKIISYYIERTLNYNSQYPDWFVLFLECFSNPNLLREGIKSITSLFNFSYEHICRVFKKNMGETMIHYLNKRRIDEAKNLMKESSFNSNEIREKVGINNQSHFNKLFEEFVGMTPKNYKISLKKKENENYEKN